MIAKVVDDTMKDAKSAAKPNRDGLSEDSDDSDHYNSSEWET